MDSQKKNYLTVHVSNDFVLNFQKCGVGLYRLDSIAPSEPKHVQLAQSTTAPLDAMPVDEPSIAPVPKPIAEPKEDKLDNTVSAYTFFSTVAWVYG